MIPSSIPPTKYACGTNNFGCVDYTSGVYRCFHGHYKCDGVEHCVDGTDEHNCGVYLYFTITHTHTQPRLAGFRDEFWIIIEQD